jgi:hypothetical protein
VNGGNYVTWLSGGFLFISLVLNASYGSLQFWAFRLLIVLALASGQMQSQTTPFREQKWGIKENNSVLIPPVFDTLFNFDPTGKVCLACFRVKGSSGNKFIKVTTVNYACNYLDRSDSRLIVRNHEGDTCSVFSLTKAGVRQLNENSAYFTANQKGKKHLVTKNFRQLTHKGYEDVSVSPDPLFYLAWQKNEMETVFAGVIDTTEKVIVPFQYAVVKVNTEDSIILACSSGVRDNADDDLYNYRGKRIESARRHVEWATRNFLVHKLYEPREHLVIYNRATHQEKEIQAEEVQAHSADEILLKHGSEWFLYDMNKNLKKPYKPS